MHDLLQFSPSHVIIPVHAEPVKVHVSVAVQPNVGGVPSYPPRHVRAHVEGAVRQFSNPRRAEKTYFNSENAKYKFNYMYTTKSKYKKEKHKQRIKRELHIVDFFFIYHLLVSVWYFSLSLLAYRRQPRLTVNHNCIHCYK